MMFNWVSKYIEVVENVMNCRTIIFLEIHYVMSNNIYHVFLRILYLAVGLRLPFTESIESTTTQKTECSSSQDFSVGTSECHKCQPGFSRRVSWVRLHVYMTVVFANWGNQDWCVFKWINHVSFTQKKLLILLQL